MPPLATAAIMRASWIGVTITAPCPMATEIVEPGIPFVVVHALDPLLRWHQPRLFAGQIDSGAPAETEAGGVVADTVDSEHLADVVEEDVAGSHDALVEIHLTVGVIAMKHAAVKTGLTGAVDRVIGGYGLRFEHGRRHHDFENGAGSELRLNRAIQQRRFRVGVELGPFLVGNAHGRNRWDRMWAG